MNGPRPSGPTSSDPGGERDGWRPSRGYLAAALGIVAAGLVLMSMSSPSPPPVAVETSRPTTVPVAASNTALRTPEPALVAASRSASPALSAASAAASGAGPAESQQIPRTRDPNGDQTPDIADYVNPGEKPTMGEVIERLHQAGVYGGLGAFSPPGTRPPLVGLAVPEDFALPEGYVRHYQATDDGRRIEPILMFSPDARWPFAIPEDRVVPPELAPPGLPIRRVEIPAPAQPGK